MKKTLLIVDPQNDFILPAGALPVAGAVADMERLRGFIKNTDLDRIVITLDSHNSIHIATSVYWEDSSGNEPKPYTAISAEDLEQKVWTARYNADNAAAYLRELQKKGKTHTIWPAHCVYETPGWEVYAPLKDTLSNWVYKSGGELMVHLKGRDMHTEMFSAVLPEVPGDELNDTLNAQRFLKLFDDSETIYIAGEAENFCVKETVSDIAHMRPELIDTFVILKNCMSLIPVPGDSTPVFWKTLEDKGAKIIH